MPSFASFFTAIALALSPQPPGAVAQDVPPPATNSSSRDAASVSVWQVLAESVRPANSAQVRIEQHIIWRVNPMPGPARDNLSAFAATQGQAAPRLSERRMGGCIPMAWIAGGQARGGSRLLLFLRDRRMVAADLERACSARDFYSGFYVDKPAADGRLCAGRDRILARSGARCSISAFHLLVADD